MLINSAEDHPENQNKRVREREKERQDGKDHVLSLTAYYLHESVMVVLEMHGAMHKKNGIGGTPCFEIHCGTE